MAQGYDADVQLSVGLSLEDVVTQSRKITDTVEKAFSNVDSSKFTSQMKKVQSTMSKTESQIQATVLDIEELQEKFQHAQLYNDLIQQIGPARDEMKQLAQSLREAQEAGDEKGIAHFTELLNESREGVTMAEQAMEHLEAIGHDVFTQADAERLDGYKNKLGDLNNQQRLNVSAFQQLQEQQKQEEQAAAEAARLQQEHAEALQRTRESAGQLNPAIADSVNHLRELGDETQRINQRIAELNEAGVAEVGYEEYDQLILRLHQIAEERERDQQRIREYSQAQIDAIHREQEAREQLEQENRRMAQEYADVMQRALDIASGELNPEIANLTDRYREVGNEIQRLREEQEKLRSEGKGEGYKQFDEMTTAISRLKQEYSDLGQQIRDYNQTLTAEYQQEQAEIEAQRYLAETAKTSNDRIAMLSGMYQQLGESIQQMVDKQKELAAQGTGAGYQEYDRLTKAIAAAKQQYDEIGKEIDKYNQKQAEAATATGKTSDALAGLKTVGKGASTAILGIATTAVKLSPIGREFTNLKGKVDRFAKSLTGAANSNKSFTDSLKGGLKKLLAYGLGIASVTALFGKLRGAIKEGINNLVQTNGGMNQTNMAISAMMSSLNALKNAWGAAFAPILQIVAPILTRFIDMLTATVGKISQFVAAITGKKTALVAKKQDFNYAQSLDKTGASNSKKQKQAEEKYNKAVAKAQEKYDEKVKKTEAKNAEAAAKAEEKQAKAAEKLAKKQEKANKQLGAYDQLNVIAKEDAEELEDVQATEYEMPELELPNMEDYAADLAAGTDFDGMFEEIPIESMFTDLWDRIKQAWENSDFTEIGHMVGEKLKELSDQARDWLVNVAQPLGEKIGKSLGTFINGLTEVEGLADSLGRTLGEGLNTITYSINSFLDSVDWNQLGTFLGEGMNGLVDSVDWEALGHMLIMKWNALFETIQGFVDTFDFKKLGAGISTGLVTMVKDFDASALAASISGFIAGAFEAVAGFFEETDWRELADTIIEKYIDLVKGIEWDRLFTAIFEALGAALGGIGALLNELELKIGELLVEAWNDLVDWFVENAVDESGHFTIEGFLNGILDALVGIGTWIYNNIFKPFIDGFKKAFGIASPSTVMKEEGNFIMEGLKNGISEKISSVIAKFTELKTKIVKVFNDIKTNVISIWNSLWEKVKSIINTAWNGIKRVINSIIGGIEKMANGIIRGINAAVGALNNLSFDVPDWVPEIGGNTIGFDIPELRTISIPRLAQGAVIPPNKEFLAMLGDQNKGMNIETPLDTMIDAFNKALDNRESNIVHEPIVLQLDGKTVAEVVWDEEDKRYKQRGISYSPIFT